MVPPCQATLEYYIIEIFCVPQLALVDFRYHLLVHTTNKSSRPQAKRRTKRDSFVTLCRSFAGEDGSHQTNHSFNMAIARTYARLNALSLPFSPVRCVSSTVSRGDQRAGNATSDPKQPRQSKGPSMTRPAAIRRFVLADGTLRSTPGVYEFLRMQEIEIDNSKTTRVPSAVIRNEFDAVASYSPKHIMNPFHLLYLSPEGHPMVEAIKARYRRKKEKEPLWLIMQSQNGQTGLIKSLGQRRLSAAFWRAMAESGVSRWRSTEGTPIKGTVIVSLFDTLKASNKPADEFGKALAESVIREAERVNKARQESRSKSGRDFKTPRARSGWRF